MNSLVVYHSQFGNTKTLADIIGAVLKSYGPTVVRSVAELAPNDLDGFDLVVLGGPTQAHGTSPAMKVFLEALQGKGCHGMAAAFDTRLKGPQLLWGSAGKGTADLLERAGFTLAAPPESFLVKGMREPHLEDDEYARAKAWAADLGERVQSAEVLAG